MAKTRVWVILGAMLAATGCGESEAPTGDEEVDRLRMYYPHGFNFVDTIRPDGKVFWRTKEVVRGKIRAEDREFGSLGEFKTAFLKAKVNKKAAVEVHLRHTKIEGAYERAEAILNFLGAEGYEKAGGISD